MHLVDGTIAVFGEAEERTRKQIRTCAKIADKVSLMPDNDLGYGVPIGGVIAYRNAIGPAGVRCDIGCGNKAVRVDMNGADLLLNVSRFMVEISDTISFGVGRRNPQGVDSAVLDEAQDGWILEATRPSHQKAGRNLGLLGQISATSTVSRMKMIAFGQECTSVPEASGTGVASWFSRLPVLGTAWMSNPAFWR
jgi:tRNA-splicing ligase RtcB